MNFDNVSTAMLDEGKALALCERLTEEGHKACVSGTVILGTRYYTVCWND